MFAEARHALLPAACVGCGGVGSAMCASCASGAAAPTEGARFPSVDRVLCRWDYDGLPRRLILDLKLRGISVAAEPLVDGMVELALRQGLQGELVTWVPCRPSDRRRRGFDHAQVLARGVARRLGLPCVSLLRRSRGSKDQAGLGAAERAANLLGAFGSRPFRGRVVLVDDLVTTGATASSCARALRAAQVIGVEVIAPCRAGMTMPA